MNDELPSEVYKLLDEAKTRMKQQRLNPHGQSTFGPQAVYLRIPLTPVQTVEKYISLASSVIMRPNLANPTIFDTRLEAGRTYFENGKDKFIPRPVEARLRQTFDKQILPEDYEFLKSLDIARAILLRRIIRRDQIMYFRLETWDLMNNIICVFPIDLVVGNPDSTYLKEFSFSISFVNQSIDLQCMIQDINQKEARDCAHIFLDKLSTKLSRWAKEPLINTDTWRVFSRSNNCVQPDRYLDTYNTLKKDHYSMLCKIWEKVANRTIQEMDKDIHEDLAIAAYLHNAIPYITTDNKGYYVKSFVDLGCGNGLLTYLLTCLQWRGYGVDCRRRPIWNLLGYGDKGTTNKKKHSSAKNAAGWTKLEHAADLREMIINPKEAQFDKDNTRLFIGNHPDELTPWIPVIARQSQSNFIIIPCCPFKFDGTKFQNMTKMRKGKIDNAKKKQGKDFNGNQRSETEPGKNDNVQESHDAVMEHKQLAPNSTYQQYLSFIERVAIECGYKVIIDRLRIPSTRRVAIFGLYDPKQSKKRLEQSPMWYDIQMGLKWFKPPKLAEIKNCTTLPREEVERIIFNVFRFLVSEGCATEMYQRYNGDKVVWNSGAQKITLDMIIYDVLNASDRAMFSGQSKGLQTLLKNHGHVFQIVQGVVKLRVPNFLDRSTVKDKSKLLTKPCYFYMNHPNGCPLQDDGSGDQGICAFKHEGVPKCSENIKAIEDAIEHRDPNKRYLGRLDTKAQASNGEEGMKEGEDMIDLSELKLFD